MNKFFVKLLVVSLIAFPIVAMANIVSAMESIPSYQSDITIGQDSSMRVVETIVYDFDTTEHHGILRNIPYKYKAINTKPAAELLSFG
jgi:hypothetical protein